MFEKLLQKILKQVIGQFTQQIDNNNLSVGIWSGQIQINKVKLHKNLFKKFGLPIHIIFSFISQLKIKIPWKSFFSNPLIISIDSAFALCQIDSIIISPQQQIQSFIKSLKLIIANIGKKVIEKAKSQQDKQSGYFDTILFKMFDNLYLNIKNVHFRFQNIQRKFSFGLLLDSIDIHAVDQRNNQIFIDRSKLKENQRVIRRKFSLSKLKLYWQPAQQYFLIQKQLKQKQSYFLKSSKFQQNVKNSLIYIFYIDLEGLIIENNNGKSPSYEIELNQEKIELKIKKQIVQQFLFFVKRIQQLILEVKSATKMPKQCSQKSIIFLKSFCEEYISQKDVKSSQKVKDSKLKQSIKINNDQIIQLMDLNKKQLINIVQKIVLNDVGKQKLLKSLDLKQFDIKKMIEQNNQQKQKQSNIKIKFLFKLPKALVYLFSFQNRPLMQINLTNTQINVYLHNSQQKIKLNISSIFILGEQNSQIFWMNKKQKNSLEIQFYQNQKQSSVQIYLQKIQTLYNPKVINSIINFFTFTSLDSKLKNQALDKIQKIQKNVTHQIKQSQLSGSLKVNFSGFQISFLHKVHQLMLQTSTISLIYDLSQQKYKICVNLIQCYILKNNNQDHQFKLIQPFDLNLNYYISENLVQASISNLHVSLDKSIYLFLFDFIKMFSGQQKKQMLTKADIIGQIFVKQNRWKKTLSMIHRGKIFLWNQNDEYPKLKMRIRKARQVTKGKFSYIILSDKKNEIQIAFKTQNQYNLWRFQLQKIVEFGRQSELKSERMSSVTVVQEKSIDANQQIKLCFLLQKLNFHLKISEDKQINFIVEKFKYQTSPNDNSSEVKQKNGSLLDIKVKNLKVVFEREYIFKNNNFESQNFFQCRMTNFNQFNEITSLIEIDTESFRLNFDPVFMIEINSFFNEKKKPEQDVLYIVKSHQTLDKQDQDKILSYVIIKAKDSSIYFINKKTKMHLASISFQTLKLQILTKYYQFSLQGKAQNVILSDLSGYPYTIYQPQKYSEENCKPVSILCSQKVKNYIDFQYTWIQKGSSRYQKNKHELLKLEFNNFRLNFVNQVFFRVFDYIFVQLIGSITQSEFFEQLYPLNDDAQIKQNIIDFKKFVKNKDQLIRSKALSKLDKKKLQEYLFHANRFYIQLIFNNSKINLASQSVLQGILFQINQIKLQNDPKLVKKQFNQKSYDLLTQFHNIQMSSIFVSVVQKGRKTSINKQPVSLKIFIEMFNKDLQYIHLYGQNQAFTSNMNINIDIQPCKLQLLTENIITFKKFILYNLFHDDGLDFLMIYDYMDFVPEMKICVKIVADVFSLQIFQDQQRIMLDAGNFTFWLEKTHKLLQLHTECQYLVLGYAFKQLYEQVLTSRKNFGKFQPFKTSFRSFITSAEVQKQNTQSIFLFKLNIDEQTKSQEIYVSIEEVMVIFNQKLLILLNKISLKKDILIPIQKVYKQENKALKTMSITPHSKIIKFLANKIILCCKFPDSKGMILALLFTCHFKQNFQSTHCIFPHLQSFMSNQSEISGQNIDKIKKRTVLKPTQIKYTQIQDQIQLFVDRIFLKISVNDIQQLLKLQNDLMKKLSQLTPNEKRNTSIAHKSLNSASNQSSNSAAKSLIQIFDNTQQIKKSKNLSFSTIQLMIINDLQQNMIPLIYGNLIIHYQNLANQINTQFKLDFFNIRNSYWQPLIQPTKISIKFQPCLTVEIQEAMDFSEEVAVRGNKKDINQFININISTNFIENFYKSVTNKQLSLTKLYNAQQEIGLDQINSWVVVNQIGEDIICKSTDLQHEVFISANESAKITFLTNLQQTFNPTKKNQQKQKQSYLNFVICQKLQIKKLNIKELGLKKIWFIYQGKRCSILKNLVVDISKNVRYLTISSMIELQNLTDLSIRFYAPIKSKYIVLPSKSSKFVPFNLTSDQIVLSGIYQSQSRQPSTFSLSQHTFQNDMKQKSQQITLELMQKQNILHFNFMTFRVKTRFQRMKKIISLQPVYLIKNYLPQQLTVVLIDKAKQSMLNQYIINGLNQNFNCGAHPIFHEIDESQVSFYIDGYQWTDFDDFHGKKKIIFKNYLHKNIQVKIYKVNDQLKTSEIIFYYPLILKNKTISTIKIHSKNDKNINIKKQQAKQLQKDQSQILLQRDIILQVDGGFSQQIYLKNHAQFFAFRKKFNNLKTFSKYFVYKNLDKIGQDLTITQFKIFNKYLITNRTQGQIILRPYPAKTGQIQSIEKYQTADLLFFQIDSRMSVGSMFQLCPKDLQFQWSHPLNVIVVKQSTFFIRSRFDFKKKKHFILDVRKRMQTCLQIIIKQVIRQDNIPYLLINECQNKQFFVKNILQKIDPGQSLNFNWDDPFENSQNIFLQIKQIHSQKSTALPYVLDVHSKQTSTIIQSKFLKSNIQVQIIIEPARKRIIFKDQEPKNINQKQSEEILKINVNLPLRISLINNSITPATHVLDLSFSIKLYKIIRQEMIEIIKVNLSSIQIDNQVNHNALYPVILSTQMNLILEKDKNQILKIQTKQINLKIEEDFFKSIFLLKSFFENLIDYQNVSSRNQLQKGDKNTGSEFFISKLILPKIVINLQVQTKNFSIQTTINLQRPAICSFPWKQFPYPIKRIALNILSHLSISPWAFVSSFKKGIQILITQQSTGRAFQGFFGTILGAISNSLSGILGFIVGYDVERVDNLIDGIDQGVTTLFRQISQIPEFETNSCGIGNIIEGTGKTLLNIIFKPIKGVLRMTLKISEGIKKTAQFSFDEQTYIKTRPPIVFYNRQQYFLPYNKQQSKYLCRFRNITGNKLQFFYLVKFFPISLYLDKMELLLIMGTQFIVLLNVTKQNVVLVVEISKIVNMEILEVCKLKILAIQDGKDEKLQVDSRNTTVVNKKRSLEKQYHIEQKEPLSKSAKFKQVPDVEYEIWMMNENQAIQVVQMFMKIKKSSKIQF